MIDSVLSIGGSIEAFDISVWWIVFFLLIGMGIFLTFRFRGVQIRCLGRAFKYTFGRGADDEGRSISSAEAFFLSLGARVGVGNIAGIATAIFIGGPGAVMWMWIFALIGASTAFAETILGQLFKERSRDGSGLFTGGPAYYIANGLKRHKFAALAAFMIIASYTVGFTASTAATACNAFTNTFDIQNGNLVFAGIMATAVGIAIVFGMKGTARISKWAVPQIALIWLIICAIIMICRIGNFIPALSAIVGGAFSPSSLVGGGIGTVISIGLRRGIFSNEAGIGTLPNISSSAETSHPVKQGMAQSLGVLVDTLLVCSATAFAILMTLDFQTIQELGLEDAPLVQYVLSENFVGDAAPAFIALFFGLLCFTNQLGTYAVGEINTRFLTAGKWGMAVIKASTVVVIIVACIVPLDIVWDITDIILSFMAAINVVALIMLFPYIKATVDDYERQVKEGRDPVFVAEEALEGMDLSGITAWGRSESIQQPAGDCPS